MRSEEWESRLDDANLVGHIKRIAISDEFHVCLLVAIGCVERVDFFDGDLVELLDRVFDGALRGALVHEEHKRVVVLDLLHRRLGCDRVLDSRVLVEFMAARCAAPRELGCTRQLEGAGSSEVDRGPDLSLSLSELALLHRCACLLGFRDILPGFHGFLFELLNFWRACCRLLSFCLGFRFRSFRFRLFSSLCFLSLFSFGCHNSK
jgi:hypothetical protein